MSGTLISATALGGIAFSAVAFLALVPRAWRLVAALYLIIFAYDYLIRPVLIFTGLDDPYPDYLFGHSNDDLLLGATAQCCAWLLIVGMTTRVSGAAFRPGLSHFLPRVHRMPTATLTLLALAASAAAALITVWLGLKAGGISRIAVLNKKEKALGSLLILKAVPYAGIVLNSLAGFRGLTNRQWRSVLHLALTLVNGLMLYFWGIRVGLAVAVLIVGLGTPYLSGRASRDSEGRMLRRVVLTLPIVSALGGGALYLLRLERDELLSDGVSRADSGSFVRDVSVSNNMTTFDFFALAVRDWPERFSYRWGTDVVTALVAPIPRALWRSKPDQVVTGAWFRQVYEPDVVNGWPVKAVGEWYLNFGLFGVVIGAVLTGLILGAVARHVVATPARDDRFVAAAVGVFAIVESGLGVSTPSNYLLWLVGIGAAVKIFGSRRHDEEEESLPGLVAHGSRQSSG